ncbi:LamG-like jellyroll fold domain-containing protein [Plantactinospora sp. CA-294935]|uniref:LamG-like jellyroll fold domain-containing protein n=1 Tax=Plantactinospora sp. CA-294935 TaxID=3240012 RepID=UPI003D8C7FBF
MALWVVAVVAAAGGVLVDPGPWRTAAAAPAPVCTGVADSEAQASALAVACAEPVVVDGSQTEFSQVVAQPDGRFLFESAAVPQRTYRAGGWVDVDLGLVPAEGGLWRPAASVADVAFSAGGPGPLATLVSEGRTLVMSWPGGALPTPTVSGELATYPNVLPDVDLVVRATWTGFSHVFVVKSASAAANPAVRQIRFGLGGDAQVLSGPDGGLRAVVGSREIASAEPPVMWDSRTGAAGRSAGAQASPEGSESTAAAAGDAARVAPVEVEVSGGDLLLRPDAELLTAPDTVFPLYVDPAWSVYKTKWAYATNNGSSNTDYSAARVGLNPDTGALYRSFFQFSTTANGVSLRGKHIESAYVQMKLDHSWSCDDTVASMYWTSAINATPKASWSIGLKAFMDSASGHANESGGCESIQPDMIMNFSGSGVTSRLRTVATDGSSSVTVGFTARASDGSGESTQGRWKKFFPNSAKLYVDYDTKPGQPNGLQVAGVACPTSGVLTVGTLSPTLSAVFPDADKADSLTGTFEWIEVPAGGMGSVTDTSPTRKSAPPARTGITPNARATSNTVSIVADKTYAFRARGTDKPPYSLPSVWSAWCQFTADTTVPPVEAKVVTAPAGPGTTGRVRFESTASDVTKFRYGWDAATKEVPAQGSNPRYAEVDLTAPSFGRNVLLVKAIDATLNEGNGSVEFTVGRPAPPIAEWGLQTYPGVDQAAALADGQPAPIDSSLTATNVAWANGVRMVGGQTAAFNGSSSAATTAASVVDTTRSFSVAAWVRLGAVPTTADVKVVAQSGVDAAGFELGVRRMGTPLTPYWSFVMKDTAAQSSTTRAAVSTAAITGADVGRWTHLAGVYDATEKMLRLYVNGQQVAEAERTAAPWPASGRLVVGHSFNAGAVALWWNGAIADVQVFDRVLVRHDFTGQLAMDPLSGGFNEPGILTPVQVGNWDFEAAAPCYLANLKDTCEAPETVTGWGRWLALTRGAAVGAGRSTSGSGLWLDYEYFPEEGHTEPAEEYGRSAVKTGVTPPDSEGREFTTWQETPVLRTDDSFTMSAWVTLDRLDGMRTAVAQRGAHESAAWLKYSSGDGKWQFNVSAEDVNPSVTTGVSSTSAPETGVWTHLAGVYDASRSEIRLYVNGELEGRRTISFRPMSSSGPLLVGRVLWHDGSMDQWTGGIDDVAVFQGAMSDASMFEWYNAQIPVTPGTNVLTRGEELTEGQYLRSDIGNYQLLMQDDGNLVLYQAGYPLWDTATWGNPGAHLLFQVDGNVVLYSADDVPLWDTETWGSTADRLVLRDDGELVLLDTNGQVMWRR